MSVHIARMTSKAQATVPKAVREALGVRPGDQVAYRVEPDRVTVERVATDEELWKRARAAWEPSWASFAEDWLSPEDCEAYDGLLDDR